nr:DUF6443 domain-containing protein [uncultured Allomuricauda sp.]
MKKISIYIAAVFMATTAMAQTPTTVEKPEQGQSTYIVSGSATLEATTSITLGPGTHIQSGATFTATIVEQTTATDPYTTFTFSDENYVFTRSYQEEMSSFNAGTAKEGDVIESITYFDGLGRPMQQIGIKGAPDKEDIIVHMEYDDYGRMDEDWLPYHEPTGTLGTYRGDKASATRSYYKTNYGADFPTFSSTVANAYSKKEFEASPLNRLLKQGAPGEDWALGEDHEIEFGYGTNVASEVRLFEVTTSLSNNTYTPTLVQNGYYTAGELYKTVTKDENWTSGTNHTTEEFTDKQGRVVLKRTHNSGEHDTYYVYDDFGNLTYVIPPKVTTASVSTTELNELCYQYKYDHRNRLVEKKLPGKGTSTTWESIVYNGLDQPIMTQDPNQDTANEWLFTKYDAFGRVAYTGLDTGNSSARTSVQSLADSETDQYESRSGASTYGGTTVYYTNTAYPSSFDQVYTINYYDDYVDTDGLSVPSTVLGQTTATNVKGLATVSKVRVLTTNDWITTITGYDQKGRAIYTASRNDYLGITDIVETELDFGGKVVQTKTTHTKDGNSAIVTVDDFTYDHEGRLLRQKQTIGSQSQETLVDNTYDDLGQLVQKEVGGGLQTVDYEYNIRGWLKSINNGVATVGDLWGMKIAYNDPTNFGANEDPPALFNGNISQVEWNTATNNNTTHSVSERYSYTYDALNRIKSAFDNTGNYNLVNVDYDPNGNITDLERKGHTALDGNGIVTSFLGTMDNLVYTYDSGNKLTKVLDNGNDTYGFVDGINTTTEYTYDTNGNMLRDLNKGMTADMGYNHLNLPTSVSMPGGTISYIYDAVGTKLKKTAGSSVTEYAGNYIYEGGTLQFFNHPEGYVTPDGSGGYDYVYQYKDHLGNIRLSYEDGNGNGSVDQSEIIEENNYYPFGLEHKGYNSSVSSLGNSVAQRWKFGGKEFNEELDLDWYDVSARNYDPALGRWMNLDPLAEKMRRHSPYNYAFNNPIYFFDPDGMMPCPNGDCPESGFFSILKSYYNSTKNTIQNRIDGVVNLITKPGETINAIVQNTPKSVEEAVGATIDRTIENSTSGKLAITVLETIDGAQQNGVEGAVEAVTERMTNTSIDAATSLIGLGAADDALSGANKATKAASGLADDVPVVRGGSNIPDRFDGGSGVFSRLSDRHLDGISVNSRAGATVEELSSGIPHNRVGVTTVGDIRKAGGDVVPSPTRNNPLHATMSIPNSRIASMLMRIIKNPNKSN